MRHILLIDPLEKLNIKKDSSLMLALTLKNLGAEAYILFEKDFSIHNQGTQKMTVYDYDGEFKPDGCYLDSFELLSSRVLELCSTDMIHMRLDPPFDSRYLRVLWMLDDLAERGLKILNHPRGIMQFNEKLYAYRSPGAIPSFVGASLRQAKEFINNLKTRPSEIILKPMDLYSGIGVEKVSFENWESCFLDKIKNFKGPVIVQPFQSAVSDGEIRSIYFGINEIGTILKVPKSGEFLSNIAQGASFKKWELSVVARNRCEKIAKELEAFGVYWIAFDILGDSITEVNITCPGLLVEVSYAYQKNLASKILELINQRF